MIASPASASPLARARLWTVVTEKTMLAKTVHALTTTAAIPVTSVAPCERWRKLMLPDVISVPAPMAKASHMVTEGENEFVLLENGKPRLSVTYPPPPMHYDNWSDDEELMDLFQWLASYLTAPGFYKKYTT